ncbi:hypothetical protein H5410_020259 [Solanum commersonii]|uniref:Dolichyl-diphosphooligosaccharide--protein glycosyltransferase subunit 4 n=2 Tax=Solanum TaxID=4107 RepID=A0A9J5Z8J8_SOLCO|nr:hypothetical protein H5410_020259 [Solanum commersonii]
MSFLSLWMPEDSYEEMEKMWKSSTEMYKGMERMVTSDLIADTCFVFGLGIAAEDLFETTSLPPKFVVVKEFCLAPYFSEIIMDDQDLGFFANFLGIFIFVFVIAYHYVVADPKYLGN